MTKPNLPWIVCFSFFLASTLLFAAEPASKPCFNVKDYGAVGDGETFDTQAIQAAIDDCSQHGGGDVVFPSGTFLSGTVWLKDDVALFLTPSAVLKGSPNLDDYPKDRGKPGFIRADKATNIGLYGRGTIHGSGDHPNFWHEDPKNGLKGRPLTVLFQACREIKIKEITIRNGACWNISVENSDCVAIDDVNIFSRVIANNDGIDIVDCHNTKISNCHIEAGDDAICPKSHSKRGVKNLVITNCLIRSDSNGIKFGTKSVGGFQDVAISNCVLFETRLSGIALEVVDGGVMDRIVINNITMHRVNGSILLKIGTRAGGPGVLRNVAISNVVADGIGSWKPDKEEPYFKEAHDSRIGLSISGHDEAWIENVLLSNISLQFEGGGTEEDARRPDFTDQRLKGYPEYHNFGVTPAYGINCRYTRNIRFHNVSLDYHREDARPAMMLQHTEEVRIDALQARLSETAPACLRVKDSRGLTVTGCTPREAAVPFLLLEGESDDITLMNNDFRRVGSAFRCDDEKTARKINVLSNLEKTPQP